MQEDATHIVLTVPRITESYQARRKRERQGESSGFSRMHSKLNVESRRNQTLVGNYSFPLTGAYANICRECIESFEKVFTIFF